MKEANYNQIYKSGHWINIGPATYSRLLLLKKIAKWNKNDVVLDVGCGSGRFVQLLSPFVKEIHGIDISGEALKIARSQKIKNAFLKKGNALKIPYKDNFFDKVICIDVIEHIKDDEKVLKEIRRVLKKNGEAIIYFVAIFNPNHFHLYDTKKIIKLVKKSNLKLMKIIAYRTLLNRIVRPLRKPIKKTKENKKICLISKIFAFINILESYIPFLPLEGYMVKIKKLIY